MLEWLQMELRASPDEVGARPRSSAVLDFSLLGGSLDSAFT